MKKFLYLLLFFGVFASTSIQTSAQDSCDVTVWQDTTVLPDSIILYAVASGTAPFTYQWSTGELTPQIAVGDTIEYCVTITDATGCISSDCLTPSYYWPNCWSYINSMNTAAGWLFTGYTQGGTPPYQYYWSTGDTTQSIYPNAEGLYCVYSIDAVGCVSYETCTYFQGNPPVDSCEATIAAITDSIGVSLCAYSTGQGPYSYLWSTGDSTFIINVVQEGIYCVTVVDAAGCEASTCYDYMSTGNPDSCYAYIQAISTGTGESLCAYSSGPGPYTYEWSTGETSFLIDVWQEGTYCVTVVDALGCEANSCYYYAGGPDPDSCYVNISMFQDSSIIGAFLYAGPVGNSPFSYLWSTGETTSDIFVDQAGTYCVTITDSQGCESSDCIFFAQNNCSIYIYEDTTAAGYVLIADTPANGPVPFTFQWSTGELTQQISVTTPGTYCVTFTDGGGCQATDCYYFVGDGWNNICGYVFLQDSFSMIGSTTIYLYLLENGGTTLVDTQYYVGEDYGWYYEFNDLPAGDYIVKAAIDAGAVGADDYVPTYHFSAVLWEDADVISIPSSNYCQDGSIMMVPDGDIDGNGYGAINGNVSNLAGPLEGITILLYDDQGNLITYLYTDENGQFTFLNLPLGTFQVVIEYTGFNHASYWVRLTDDTPRVVDLTFEVLNGAISTGTYELALASSLKTFPNPASDLFMIQLDESWGTEVEIKMLSLEGKILQIQKRK